jgi:hypothetical protein
MMKRLWLKAAFALATTSKSKDFCVFLEMPQLSLAGFSALRKEK